MNIDTISTTNSLATGQNKPAADVDQARKSKDSMLAEPSSSEQAPKVQPEELLDQLKAVTQDGLYSVRFETSEETKELVVKIFDNETQEVIRQIPAEELLNFKATFEELVGNLVNIKG